MIVYYKEGFPSKERSKYFDIMIYLQEILCGGGGGEDGSGLGEFKTMVEDKLKLC